MVGCDAADRQRKPLGADPGSASRRRDRVESTGPWAITRMWYAARRGARDVVAWAEAVAVPSRAGRVREDCAKVKARASPNRAGPVSDAGCAATHELALTKASRASADVRPTYALGRCSVRCQVHHAQAARCQSASRSRRSSPRSSDVRRSTSAWMRPSGVVASAASRKLGPTRRLAAPVEPRERLRSHSRSQRQNRFGETDEPAQDRGAASGEHESPHGRDPSPRDPLVSSEGPRGEHGTMGDHTNRCATRRGRELR